VPKDKAIKRFVVRNLVDASGAKDLSTASVYDSYTIPKMYYKAYYSVSAAIHQHIVRPRNRDERKNREPPRQVLKKWEQQRQKERETEKKKIDAKRKRVEAMKSKQINKARNFGQAE